MWKHPVDQEDKTTQKRFYFQQEYLSCSWVRQVKLLHQNKSINPLTICSDFTFIWSWSQNAELMQMSSCSHFTSVTAAHIMQWGNAQFSCYLFTVETFATMMQVTEISRFEIFYRNLRNIPEVCSSFTSCLLFSCSKHRWPPNEEAAFKNTRFINLLKLHWFIWLYLKSAFYSCDSEYFMQNSRTYSDQLIVSQQWPTCRLR